MPRSKMPALAVLGAILVAAACAPDQPTTTPSAPPLSPTEAPSSPHPFADMDAWIAYQTNRGGAEGVWLIHPDGTGDHKIPVAAPGEHLHPDWAPDGSQLVVTSREERDVLYLVDPITGGARILFSCVDACIGDDEAVWSPDGTRVAFVRAMEPFVDDVPSCALFVGDVTSGEVEQLSETRSCFDRETFPHWSRDGSRIAYYRGVYEGDTPVTTALYVFDLVNGTEKRLTEPTMFAGDSDWSAGDEWIVFSTYPLNDFQCCKASDLYRIHPDGTGLEKITTFDSEELRATQPRFTPDGAWLVFTSVTPSARVPWVMPADGGEAIAVAAVGIYTHPTWQPGH